METRTDNLLQEAKKIMGKNADIFIISHKDGQCSAVTHGDSDNIAQAIFSCMHQPNNPIGAAIYRILKLNAMNMIANNSPYSADLLQSINSILPDDE